MRKRKWNEATIMAAVRSCSSRAEFERKYKGAMLALFRHYKNLIPMYEGALPRTRRRPWTESQILAAMRSCATRAEFERDYKGAILAITKRHRHLYEEMDKAFGRSQGLSRRSVYAIICEASREVYVGLSHNPKARLVQHKNGSNRSTSHLNLDECKLVVLHSDLTEDEASKAEVRAVEGYSREGWVVLNAARPGCLGSPGSRLKWTPERVRDEMRSHATRESFVRGAGGAYTRALQYGMHGIMDELWPPKALFGKNEGPRE